LCGEIGVGIDGGLLRTSERGFNQGAIEHAVADLSQAPHQLDMFDHCLYI
jgi:hypothetical protein